MTDSLRCATVQLEPARDDKPRNLALIRLFAERAAREEVRILAFPEMVLTGYWHLRGYTEAELRALAEPVDGDSVTQVSELARDLGLAIGFGFLESADAGLFNSYAVCLPDGSVHCHRKLHAFENEAISSGDRYTVFDTPWGVRVGVLICWDNNLVENVRATTLLGAQILLAPHQTGGTDSRSPHGMKNIPVELWRDRFDDEAAMAALEAELRGPNGREWLMRWLPARAHDNGLFVVFSNGIGHDDGEIRTGHAMILDPYGRVVAEATAAWDAMAVADLDLGLLETATGRRWLTGRRPELYDVLTWRFGNERDPRTVRFSREVPSPTISDSPARRATLVDRL